MISNLNGLLKLYFKIDKKTLFCIIYFLVKSIEISSINNAFI
jgi:hypothetical protein